jgi:hypothetical protein
MLGFGARSTTRSTRVSVPRTSVSCVTRVTASSSRRAARADPGLPRRGACTALRVSPVPRFCMLRETPAIDAGLALARGAGFLVVLDALAIVCRTLLQRAG